MQPKARGRPLDEHHSIMCYLHRVELLQPCVQSDV
jgi:hypothetical protein